MESSKSYTIRTETGEIRLMTQEEVGALVRSTMEKARAMAPMSPVSPKSPLVKPISPTSPYTSTSQRLSRSPRTAKKFQLRLSPRNGSAKPFYESSSSSFSPQKNTTKVKVTEARTEKTTTRAISTEERFTAMVTEKNFTVHTQAAGRKNLSETEINDLVRNSIRRARENAKTKTPRQLEMSFQNAVMLNEVTASPVKRFSWSSPEPSIDDDDDDDDEGRNCQENSVKKRAANVQASQENQSQDPCDVSSIDGKPNIRIQETSSVKGQVSPRIDMTQVNLDSEIDVPPQQQKTPLHTNVSSARSPYSVGSANKSFRSFFGGVEGTAQPKNSGSYGRRRDTPINGKSAVVSPESPTIHNANSQVDVALAKLAGFTPKPLAADNAEEGQLQTIPESPLRLTSAVDGQRSVSNGASSTPTVGTVETKQLETIIGSPAEPNRKPGRAQATPTAKPSDMAATADSASVCPSESSRRSRLDVVVTSEDFKEMKKENGDGTVTGATRLEYTPGEDSSEDEQGVSEMTDIVHLTMLRARQTAEAAQNSLPDPELEEFPQPDQSAAISPASTPALPGARTVAQPARLPESPSEAIEGVEESLPEASDAVTSQQSEETTIVSNTFRDRLAAPDLQSDRVRRGALSMPIMHEDTEDESLSDQPLQKLELSPRQEASFSQPARSAIAFISATTERGAKRNPTSRIKPSEEEPAMCKQAEKTGDIDAADANKTEQFERNNKPAPDAPVEPDVIALEDLGISSSAASELNIPDVNEERATESTTVSGRLSRQLLSLKLSESSEGEFPIAKKVRESLSASLKAGTGTSVSRFTRSRSDDSDDQHVGSTSTRRFRVRTNRKQRKGSVSSLTIETDTVITAELIADLASRKGQTVTAEELNKMILGSSTNRGSQAETVDSGVLSPTNGADVRCTIQSKDQDIVMSLPMQFCVDFMDLLRAFDFRRTGDDEDNEDYISIIGAETPMEESDEFEPLQEVAEETTTCDTDIDGVDTNPRMTFSFSVPDEDTSSSSTSMYSDEESSNIGGW